MSMLLTDLKVEKILSLRESKLALNKTILKYTWLKKESTAPLEKRQKIKSNKIKLEL